MLPRKVVMAGVLYMNPSERAILDLLLAKGVEVVELDFEGEATTPICVVQSLQSDEFEQVAEWVNAHPQSLYRNPACRSFDCAVSTFDGYPSGTID